MRHLRIALCQLDLCVGDIDGNAVQVIAAMAEAEVAGCHLAVFPELTLTGYPPEDLVLRPHFVSRVRDALARVAHEAATCVSVVGFVEADRDLFNAVALCHGGTVQGVYRKQELPNYGVFDEARYFTPGPIESTLYEINGVRVGLSICEDAWNPAGPIARQAAGGAEIIVNCNASPFTEGRIVERERMLATRAADASCTLVYVNQVGGQDELVFDGGSMVVAPSGEIVARLGQFTAGVDIVDVPIRPVFRKRMRDPRGRATLSSLPAVMLCPETTNEYQAIAHKDPEPLTRDAQLWHALVTGTRAYVTKNGFADVVLGLSGGIDSSLVAAIAVDALGAQRVHGVAMPSRFSSDGSLTDAYALAASLGIDIQTIEIESVHGAFLTLLDPVFANLPVDVTEQNIQARIRGAILMALSNKFGWMVLTTGNKSETAVGYSTLYGDTAGAFAVIKDVFKTRVYELCRWYNAQSKEPRIPETVLTKPPSAELAPDQRDDQSLPPYDVLDEILQAYVEDDLTGSDLVALGCDPTMVSRVLHLVDRAEYKRRQSPPGVRVSQRAFGKDWRLPLANGDRNQLT